MFGILNYLFSKNAATSLIELIKDQGFLVDVRSPEEYATGHVSGSVNIPLDTISQRLDLFNSKKNIIVFCKSGIRSHQAKAILNHHGFTNVTNGGTWQNINKLIHS